MFTFTELLMEAQALSYEITEGGDKWNFETDAQQFQLRMSLLQNGTRKAFKKQKGGGIVFSLWEITNDKANQKIKRISKPLNVVATIAEIVAEQLKENKQATTVFLRVPNKTNVQAVTRITARYIKMKAQQWEVLGAVDDGAGMAYITVARKGTDAGLQQIFGEKTTLTVRQFIEVDNEEEAQKLMAKGNAIIRRMISMDPELGGQEPVEPEPKVTEVPVPTPVVEPVTKPVEKSTSTIKSFDDLGTQSQFVDRRALDDQRVEEGIQQELLNIQALTKRPPPPDMKKVITDDQIYKVLIDCRWKLPPLMEQLFVNKVREAIPDIQAKAGDRMQLIQTIINKFEEIGTLLGKKDPSGKSEEAIFMVLGDVRADVIKNVHAAISGDSGNAGTKLHMAVTDLISTSSLSDADAKKMLSKTKFKFDKSKFNYNYSAEEMKKDVTDFYKLANGKMDPLAFEYISKLKGQIDITRATALPDHGMIHVGDALTKSLTWHEMGHFLEVKNPWIVRAATKLMDKRYRAIPDSAGAKVKSLNALKKCTGYGKSEVALDDGFIDYYVGKIYTYLEDGTFEWSYQDATEVVSMGMQYLSNPIDIAKLAEKDPEHLAFMFYILKRLKAGGDATDARPGI